MSFLDFIVLVNNVWIVIVLLRFFSENLNVLMYSFFLYFVGLIINICNKI